MFVKRLIFEKASPAIYYSHLDLMRCFERAIRRAALPICYTEGFNPRPSLSFAQPLSLGTTGLHEVLDLKLSEDIPNDELKRRLNAALPDGVTVHTIGEPAAKLNYICAAQYSIVLPYSKKHCDMLDEFLASPVIEVVKLNKKKQKTTLDIKPMIFDYRISCGAENTMQCTLACGSEKNLNPTLIFFAFAEAMGIDPAVNDLKITREFFILNGSYKLI